jgi:hypothetical protein
MSSELDKSAGQLEESLADDHFLAVRSPARSSALLRTTPTSRPAIERVSSHSRSRFESPMTRSATVTSSAAASFASDVSEGTTRPPPESDERGSLHQPPSTLDIHGGPS